jgi:predicted nuclease of predicted toxin-antitoxin system
VAARFYLDEDVSLGLRDELRNVGHDAVHVRDLGTRGRPDSYHLLSASQDQRILIAHNRDDYLLLHDAWNRWSATWNVTQGHAGILCLPHMKPRELFFAVDVFLHSSLSIVNECYTYDQAMSWIVDRFQL